jgi:hypothetical protein
MTKYNDFSPNFKNKLPKVLLGGSNCIAKQVLEDACVFYEETQDGLIFFDATRFKVASKVVEKSGHKMCSIQYKSCLYNGVKIAAELGDEKVLTYC